MFSFIIASPVPNIMPDMEWAFDTHQLNEFPGMFHCRVVGAGIQEYEGLGTYLGENLP